MLTQSKREEVLARIGDLLQVVDVSKLSSQQAYERLYPDQVSADDFFHCWRHVLAPPSQGEDGSKAEAAKPAKPVTVSTPAAPSKLSELLAANATAGVPRQKLSELLVLKADDVGEVPSSILNPPSSESPAPEVG